MELIMRLFAFVLLCACVRLPAVHAANSQATETFEFQKYCNTSEAERTILKAAFLKLDKGMLGQTSCYVKVRSLWQTGDSRLRMQILTDELNVPCSVPGNLHSSLRIFTDTSNGGLGPISYPEKICSNGTRYYEAMYLNAGSTIVLELLVDQDLLPEVSLNLLFTATGYSHEPNIDDFQCVNNLRVVKEVTCDGNNNCGDYSDEMEEECPLNERLSFKFHLSLGLGVGVGLPLLLALCWFLKVNHYHLSQYQPIGGAPAGRWVNFKRFVKPW